MCKIVRLLANGQERECRNESRAALELGFQVMNVLNEMAAKGGAYVPGLFAAIQVLDYEDDERQTLNSVSEIRLQVANSKLY